MKTKIILYAVAWLALSGCETANSDLGTPVRVIETPFSEPTFAKLADSYYKNNEYWRQDAKSVCQIEIYKLEGKNAVLLEDKTQVSKIDQTVMKITTLKQIYVFSLLRKQMDKPLWWIEKIEIYPLPSQNPADNPALKQTPDATSPPSPLN